MKNVLLSFILLFTIQLGFAQITTDVTAITDNLTATQSKDYHIKVTNNSNTSQTIKWVRTQNFPAGWTGIVCDDSACYSPSTNTSSSVTLAAGATADYKYTVTSSDDQQGTTEFVFSFTSDENISKTVNYTFNPTSTSTTEVDIAQLKVYPNPTTDYIQLSTVEGIAQIEMYSLIGKKARVFEVNDASEKFNVSNLANGMYLVRLLDKDGDAVVTKRITKR